MPKDEMIEKDIQDRFFDILMDQKKGFEGTALNVYQKLVYMRYEEVIKTSLPLFAKHIGEAELEDAIKVFMKNSPETPFVWKIPNDFRKFTKKNKLFKDRKYLYELMYYDWVEIELYMKEYKIDKQKKFKFKNSYSLTQSARIKKFTYDIIGNNFTDKKENYVVVYHDFDSEDVIYREINPLIYFILKNLNEKENFEEVLRTICEENEIDLEEAKALLKEPFIELYLKRVFSQN